MRQKRTAGTGGGEKTIRDIRRATRRQYSAEEKIRIVLDGLRGEDKVIAWGWFYLSTILDDFSRYPFAYTKTRNTLPATERAITHAAKNLQDLPPGECLSLNLLGPFRVG